MKKIFIIIPFSFLMGCSLSPWFEDNDIDKIQKVQQEAIHNIEEETEKSVKLVNEKVNSILAKAKVTADTALTKKVEFAIQTIGSESQKANETIRAKVEGINERINLAIILACIGILFGIIGTILSVLAYFKRPHLNIHEIHSILIEAIDNHVETQKSLGILMKKYLQVHQLHPDKNQIQVQQIVNDFLKSKTFEEKLKSVIENFNSVQSSTNTQMEEDSVLPSSQPMKTVELYARNSKTNVLPNIQQSYQRGKSIYKLILKDIDSKIAEVDLCKEVDAQQLILGYNNEFLEPICEVTRKTNNPTKVVVHDKGSAERVGEEWVVTRPIKVELR